MHHQRPGEHLHTNPITRQVGAESNLSENTPFVFVGNRFRQWCRSAVSPMSSDHWEVQRLEMGTRVPLLIKALTTVASS